MPVIFAFKDSSIIDLETSSNSFLSGLQNVLLPFLATAAYQRAVSPAVPPKYPRGPIRPNKVWKTFHALNCALLSIF